MKLIGKKALARLATCTRGATAIEYGLIAALIAVAAITALQSVGGSVSGTMDTAADAMSAA